MKKIIILLILILYSITSYASIHIEKEWTIEDDFMSISESKRLFGIINEKIYKIINSDGEVILEGKNVWNGNAIIVSEHGFAIHERNYVWRVFDLDGEKKWETVFWAYFNFTPTGKHILIIDDYGELFSLDGTRICELEFYCFAINAISPDDRYAIGEKGIFEIQKGRSNKIIEFKEPLYSYQNAFFLNDVNNCLVEFEDDRKTKLKMYDLKSKKVLWEKKYDRYPDIYGEHDIFLVMTSNSLEIYKFTGEFLGKCTFQNEKLNTNIGVYQEKELIFLNVYNDGKSNLVIINYNGNILKRMIFDSKTVFDYNFIDQKIFTFIDKISEGSRGFECYKLIFDEE